MNVLRPLLTSVVVAALLLACGAALAQDPAQSGESQGGGPAQHVVSPGKPARAAAPARPRSNKVYVVPINGFIGPGLAYFVGRSVKQAKQAGAGLIIFEICTDGGRVDSALEICTHIDSAAPIKTVAYITGRAWSAGALISIACDEIYMRAEGTIGSAQPVSIGQGGTKALGEKYVSAVRAKFRAWAEKKGYPPELAVAMVDKDTELKQVVVNGMKKIVLAEQVESLQKKAEKAKKEFEVVKTVIAKDKLLNLSAHQALDYNFISGIIETRSELVARCGIESPQVIQARVDWSESLVRFASHPAVSGLLMMVGLLGVWMEFKTPGFGLPGGVGIACFALLFGSHFLLGHANTAEILIFVVGLGLIALEIFVIPGFGIAGVLGLVFMAVGLLLSLQRFTIPDPTSAPWDVDIMWENVMTMMVSLSAALVIFFFLLRLLPNTPFLNRLVLQASEKAEAGYVSSQPTEKDLLGKTGVALSTLRPAGRAEIDGQVVDVMTDGDWLESGQRLEVVRVEGNRVVVRQV